jgi:hypothetical protein
MSAIVMPAGNELGGIRNGSVLVKTATGIGESGGKDSTWSTLTSMSTVSEAADRNEEMVCLSAGGLRTRRYSGQRPPNRSRRVGGEGGLITAPQKSPAPKGQKSAGQMSAPGLWGQELARLTIKHDPHRIVPRTNALTLAHKKTRLGCGGSLTLDAGPAKGGAGARQRHSTLQFLVTE